MPEAAIITDDPSCISENISKPYRNIILPRALTWEEEESEEESQEGVGLSGANCGTRCCRWRFTSKL